MKILLRDGRLLQGTALQIVKQMRDSSLLYGTLDIRNYIAQVVLVANEFDGVGLDVEGKTDAQLAEALLEQMLARRLATVPTKDKKEKAK